MAIFISSGHHKNDPGAVANGTTEAAEMMQLRDLVHDALKRKMIGVKVIKDNDSETLSQYLNRIQTGAGSVVIEFHMDAAGNDTATGCTAIIPDDYDPLDKSFATDIVNVTAAALGIRNRGVILEKNTHRGRLGLMREQGTVCLLEVCFLTNANDLQAYRNGRLRLADAIADVLLTYEKKV